MGSFRDSIGVCMGDWTSLAGELWIYAAREHNTVEGKDIPQNRSHKIPIASMSSSLLWGIQES